MEETWLHDVTSQCPASWTGPERRGLPANPLRDCLTVTDVHSDINAPPSLASCQRRSPEQVVVVTQSGM